MCGFITHICLCAAVDFVEGSIQREKLGTVADVRDSGPSRGALCGLLLSPAVWARPGPRRMKVLLGTS